MEAGQKCCTQYELLANSHAFIPSSHQFIDKMKNKKYSPLKTVLKSNTKIVNT
jgi:hypothetical protein